MLAKFLGLPSMISKIKGIKKALLGGKAAIK